MHASTLCTVFLSCAVVLSGAVSVTPQDDDEVNNSLDQTAQEQNYQQVEGLSPPHLHQRELLEPGHVTQAITTPYPYSAQQQNYHQVAVQSPQYQQSQVGQITQAIATPYPHSAPTYQNHQQVSYVQDSNSHFEPATNLRVPDYGKPIYNYGKPIYGSNQDGASHQYDTELVPPAGVYSNEGATVSGYVYVSGGNSDPSEYDGIYVPSWLGGLKAVLRSGQSYGAAQGYASSYSHLSDTQFSDLEGHYVPSWLGGLHGGTRSRYHGASDDRNTEGENELHSGVQENYADSYVTAIRGRSGVKTDSGYGAGTGFHGLPRLT